MAITPDTNIRLLKVPLTLDNQNQLKFATPQAQFSYFYNLPAIEIDKCNYQRKDNIIHFPAHIDSIIDYNYIMYQNDNFSNKWFYAFVEDMQYVNNNLTDIKIKTDVWQTWCFNLNFKKMFVEREHVNLDVAGLNTVDENLELGEYVTNKTHNVINRQTRWN